MYRLETFAGDWGGGRFSDPWGDFKTKTENMEVVLLKVDVTYLQIHVALIRLYTSPQDSSPPVFTQDFVLAYSPLLGTFVTARETSSVQV